MTFLNPSKKSQSTPRPTFGSSQWKKGLASEGGVGRAFNRKGDEEKKPKSGLLGLLFGSHSHRAKDTTKSSDGPSDLNAFEGKGYMHMGRFRERVRKDIKGKVPGYASYKGYKTPKKRLETLEPFRDKYGLTRESVKDILTNLYKERRNLVRSGKSLESKEVKTRTKQLEYLKRITGEKPRKY